MSMTEDANETGTPERILNAADGDAAPIDPERLAVCLEVLQQLDRMPVEHPDAIRVRRSIGRLIKTVKKRRRAERRDRVLADDNAVTHLTATGSPERIDDETAGIPLVSSAPGAIAGVLQQPRGCYICKERFTQVDAFYHQLCPDCAAENHMRRTQRTDLRGKRALLTGGRAKIGMYIALRLLRDGAHTTITTRFPRDAARRFALMPDSSEWLDRLRIVGIDLRDPAQVVALADSVADAGPLDILINNACQTVRRSRESYAPLMEAERAALPSGPLPEMVSFGRAADFGHHTELHVGAHVQDGVLEHEVGTHWQPTPDALAAMALAAGSDSMARVATGTAIDAGGLVPDLVHSNSWIQTVDEVDPIELLEVQLCNQTAPFILVSRLRSAMMASSARRRYVVNVSAMEGVFSRGYKGPGHPHTNMSKAALNMLTRTSSRELFEHGILMTAVDTGWITDERPHFTKQRLAQEGFHAPLDLSDGAARVYDPIVRGEQGEDLYSCFLKDYRKADW